MNYLLIIILSVITFAKEKPILKWAADTESGAPFVFQDPELPTKLIGFEYDIVNAICDDLGYKAEFIQNSWDGLISGIDRGDYDIAINGLEITGDRTQVVNFSIPYYITFEMLGTRASDESINTLGDLSGKTAGTLEGTLAERILKDIGGVEVKTYDSEANSYADLKNGRLDAVLIDEPVAKYYASWNPEIRLIEKPFGTVKYGIVAANGNDSLITKINKSIAKLASTGKLREIYENWNLWNEYMADHFNDFSKSTSEHPAYKEYMKYQKRELTWQEQMERYIVTIPNFLGAALTTLYLSIFSMILAIILGLSLALIRVYAPKPFSYFATLYIELFRGTPLLIQLYLIYYGLPQIGIPISPIVAAILGLGMNYAAYEAETYRAGLYSVPRGQLEAAISLGMNKTQALRFVIVPQAIRLVIPPVTNDFIALLKDSSLVSVIAMTELTKVYFGFASTYFDFIGFGLFVSAFYLLLGLPFVRLSHWVEKKFALTGSTSTKI
jgi:polar amino acid transport system substrate-binding protein